MQTFHSPAVLMSSRALGQRSTFAVMLAALASAAMLVIAPTAHAQTAEPQGVYLGASGGLTQYRLKEGDFSRGDFGLRNSDKRDRGGKVYLGYRFNEHLAVEGQYALLGKATIDVADPGNQTDRLKYKARALSASVLGLLPLNENFTVFGKVGGARIQSELQTSNAAFGGRAKGNSNSLVLGLGATYKLSDNFDLRAEFENYRQAGKQGREGRSGISQISLGAAYRF